MKSQEEINTVTVRLLD